MKIFRVSEIKNGIIAACFVFVCLFSSPQPLRASTSNETEKLLEIIKALEIRVAALESGISQQKRVDLHSVGVAESKHNLAIQKALRTPPATPIPNVAKSAIHASNSQAHASLPQDTWSGYYIGASVGFGATTSNVLGMQRSVFNDPQNAFSSYTSTSAQGKSTTSFGEGIDFFAGYNWRFSDRIVAGGQLEAGIWAANFRARGSQTTGFYAGNNVLVGTTVSDYRSDIQSLWVSSGLGRIGFLWTPTLMSYGIVGWSGGQFDYKPFNERFFAHGPTAGTGLESKVGSNWSIKGEYRFTQFLPATQRVDTFVNNVGGTNTLITSRGRFENASHTLRAGVAYAFDQ